MGLPHFGLSYLEFLVGIRPRCHLGFLHGLGVTFFGVHAAVDDVVFDGEFEIRDHTGGCWIHIGSGSTVVVVITMQHHTLVPWVFQMLASRNTGTPWFTKGRFLSKHIRMTQHDELCLASLCCGTPAALTTYRMSVVDQRVRYRTLRNSFREWLLSSRARKRIRDAVLEWACRPGNVCMRSAEAHFNTLGHALL